MQNRLAGRYLRRCGLLGLLLFAQAWLSSQSMAAQITVTDAAGEPLANAVLLIDGVPPRPDASYLMDQVDRQFVPHVLVVPVGAQVDFPNSDDVRHHVYSFSEAKPFELRLFKGEEAPPVMFKRPGAVVLGCNIHDAMVGYILVTEHPRFAVSDAAGLVSLPDLPAGSWPVSWWHPAQFQQPPVALGELDLSQQGQTVSLPITPVVEGTAPTLSPLQQRFKSLQ